jgi:hypothetical protein
LKSSTDIEGLLKDKNQRLLSSLLAVPEVTELRQQGRILAVLRALARALCSAKGAKVRDLQLAPDTPAFVLESLQRQLSGQLLTFQDSYDKAFFLADCYDSLLAVTNPKDQHRRGAFLTPSRLAQDLVARLFASFKWRRGFKLCDPAMGGAVFLLAVVKELDRQGFSRALLFEAVYGVDKSAPAVEAARFAFALLGAPVKMLTSHLCLGNSLFPKDHPQSAGILDSQFDLIIGNPPWVSFSGRQKEELDEELKAILEQSYGSFQSSPGRSWPSLHGAFLERMAGLLSDGGRLGVLFPAQVTDLEGYRSTRLQVEKFTGPPQSIWDLGEDAFPGVASPVVFAIFDCQDESRSKSKGETWLQAQDGLGARLEEAVEQLDEFPKSCFGDMGVHTGNVAKTVLAALDQGVAVREGKQVFAYKLLAPTKALKLAAKIPENGYWRHRSLEHYKKVPILIRQTAARPVAARHSSSSFFRNSILACYGMEAWPVEVLLAVLNSELLATLHEYRYRDARQRCFPQVKVRHLRSYPCPRREQLDRPLKGKGTLGIELCWWVQKLEAGPNNEDLDLLIKVERLVGVLYGLDEALCDELVAKICQRLS